MGTLRCKAMDASKRSEILQDIHLTVVLFLIFFFLSPETDHKEIVIYVIMLLQIFTENSKENIKEL